MVRTTDTGTCEGPLLGLSDEEVAERVAAGLTNADTDVRTKSAGQILAGHLLTPLNAVILVLALIVAWTGKWINGLFVIVAVGNVVIGSAQELYSKHKVDQLALLAARDVRVIRAGEERAVPSRELVLDDLVRLSHGDQVPADAVIVRGHVHMNESLLTGESRPVPKGPGDELLSGSFVESGSLVARVTRVGQEGYAARINAEAKYVKPVSSVILTTLNAVVKVGATLAVPLGVGIWLSAMVSDGVTAQEAALTAVASVLGMIPQGLALLTSSVLVLSTMRLALKKVLVQQPYCVETLARVDTLCLDKTGTITSGQMEVFAVEPADGVAADEVERALAQVARANEADANDTALAVLAHADALGLVTPPARSAVPFDSERKCSGCVTASGRALVMGAAGFVLDAPGVAQAEAIAARSFDVTDRVLVVAEAAGFDGMGRPLAPVRLLGCVAVRDEVRATAAQTMAFFVDAGVDLRVISGDDPRTVSAAAARAGVPHATDWVDATTLATPDELRDAVGRYHVFGRVTPQQKRELVRELRGQGHVVAMTGDGVNDVLALREADCSVAMASGASAARNVSEIVLTDDDFAHMPEVVFEGRRSINNLQRSAVFFLVKTFFSAVLAVVCIVMPPYPFVPIQMSLISFAIIGTPSFLLALEPNRDRVGSDFLLDVFARSLPAAAAIAVALVAELLVGRALGHSFDEISTVCTVLVLLVGMLLLLRVSAPVTPWRALVVACVLAIMVAGLTLLGPLFGFASPTVAMVVECIAIGACASALFLWLYGWVQARAHTSARLRAAVAWVERLGQGRAGSDARRDPGRGTS